MPSMVGSTTIEVKGSKFSVTDPLMLHKNIQGLSVLGSPCTCWRHHVGMPTTTVFLLTGSGACFWCSLSIPWKEKELFRYGFPGSCRSPI